MTASRSTIVILVALLLGGGIGSRPVSAEAYTVTRGVEFARPGGIPLRCDIYQPAGKGPFPAVLCVHGGAWLGGTRGELSHVARALAQRGYVVVSPDYRLAPFHKFPAQMDDLRTALRWLGDRAAEYRIDTNRLAAWGYSAGGHLVALLAARQGEGANDADSPDADGSAMPVLRAVVAGGAPCDLRELKPDNRLLSYFLGGSRAEVPERYVAASPAAHVSADDPPMLFYHGEYDILVPARQPKAMVDALKKAGVDASMHVIPKVGHPGAMLSMRAVEIGRGFLDRMLRADDE
jgi:triacylglycerol lipase